MHFKELILSLFLCPPLSMAKDLTCQVRSIAQIDREGLPSTYWDEFQYGDNQPVIQFSEHPTIIDNELLFSLYWDANNLPTKLHYDEKRELVNDLKGYVASNANKLNDLKADIARTKEMHQASPFQYFGIEQPPEERLTALELMKIIVSTRRNLRDKLQKHLDPQVIEDALLLLVGDERYMRLPGQLFANLPIIYTESMPQYDRYIRKMDTCERFLLKLQTFRLSQRVQALFQKYSEALENPRPENRNIYEQTKKDFFESLLSSGPGLRNNKPLVSSIVEWLNSCDIFFSSDRDRFLANQIQRDLPPGRGIIYRGTIHRPYLQQEFQKLCAAGASPIDSINKEPATE